jgi:hypothetical protein
MEVNESEVPLMKATIDPSDDIGAMNSSVFNEAMPMGVLDGLEVVGHHHHEYKLYPYRHVMMALIVILQVASQLVCYQYEYYNIIRRAIG